MLIVYAPGVSRQTFLSPFFQEDPDPEWSPRYRNGQRSSYPSPEETLLASLDIDTTSLVADRRFIYGLFQPDPWALRYIGQTVDPRQRFAFHRNSDRSGAPKKFAWMRELSSRGSDPTMVLFDCTDHVLASFVEATYLRKARETECDLLNRHFLSVGVHRDWEARADTVLTWALAHPLTRETIMESVAHRDSAATTNGDALPQFVFESPQSTRK